MAINCVLNERNLLSSSRAHSNNLYNWYYKSSKAYIYKKKFLAKTKAPKLISNHSMVVSGVYFNPFQGSQGPQEGSEAKILTFWPKKSFYGNAHISGTRRPTGLAQVSKRPLDRGLRTRPSRLSVAHLVSKIAYVLSSPCIFHGVGQKADSDLFWPFLTPPADPVQFFRLKMHSKCVPSIVLQVSTSTRTSRGSLRPPKRLLKARNGQNITIFGLDRPILVRWPCSSVA